MGANTSTRVSSPVPNWTALLGSKRGAVASEVVGIVAGMVGFEFISHQKLCATAQ
jgi:hypothetical protein